VEVAELRDGEAIERSRQPANTTSIAFKIGWFGSRTVVSSARANAPVAAIPAAS